MAKVKKITTIIKVTVLIKQLGRIQELPVSQFSAVLADTHVFWYDATDASKLSLIHKVRKFFKDLLVQ